MRNAANKGESGSLSLFNVTTTSNKVGQIRGENCNGNGVERGGYVEAHLIISRKTSLESFRIIFAWPAIKLALATKSGRRRRGRGWKGFGEFSPVEGEQNEFVSDFNVYSTIFVYRERRVCWPCAFNVRRINYHKNARFMRINIVFGRASKRLPDYPPPHSRNLPRILAVRCFLERGGKGERRLLQFSIDFLLR